MAEELLDPGPMMANLGATTECEIDDVNAIGVDDGKWTSATLRICARKRRVVAKVEDIASIPKRQPLEISSVPFLCLQARQGLIKLARYQQTYLNSVEGVERMHPAQTTPTKELDGETIEAAIHTIVLAEFALAVSSKVPCAFKSNQFVKEHVMFGCPH